MERLLVILLVIIVACGLLCALAPVFEAQLDASTAAVESDIAEFEAEMWESKRAIAEAKPDEIRAEGDRAEAEANAAVMRSLGEAATRSIDRQGRLLTLYIASGWLRQAGLGFLAGVACTVAVMQLVPRARIEFQKRKVEY